MKICLIVALSIVAVSLTACGGDGKASSVGRGGVNAGAVSATLAGADFSPTLDYQSARVLANAATTDRTPLPLTAAAPLDFIDAQIKWQGAQVHNYSFRYKEGGGYKFAVYPYIPVVVLADVVVSLNGVAVAPSDPAAQRLTIDNLFVQLHREHLQAAASDVRIVGADFDEILGFPTQITTNSGACCDQDHEFSLINFVVSPL